MACDHHGAHFIGFQEKGLHLNRANYGVGALIFSVSSFLLLDYLHHTSSPPINPLIFKNYSLLSSGVEVGLWMPSAVISYVQTACIYNL